MLMLYVPGIITVRGHVLWHDKLLCNLWKEEWLEVTGGGCKIQMLEDFYENTVIKF